MAQATDARSAARARARERVGHFDDATFTWSTPTRRRITGRPVSTELVLPAPEVVEEVVVPAAPTEELGPARRTVQIRTDPTRATTPLVSIDRVDRRRPPRTRAERVGHRPDRVAMWAFLLGLILVLVAAVSSHAATRPAHHRFGSRALHRGMSGSDVRRLQSELRRLGFLKVAPTGRFLSLTRRAVVRYQRSRCLQADGIAGPATIRALRTHRARCHTARRASARNVRRHRSTRVVRHGGYLHANLGSRVLQAGMSGEDVKQLQRLLDVPATGWYGSLTRRAVKAFQRGYGLIADGAVGPATREALARERMTGRTASVYGPGLYGQHTACGQKLTPRLRGVAHRSLPCGTLVVLNYGGRFTVARVVDRGPYVKGRYWDLTAATARALGVDGVATVWSHS